MYALRLSERMGMLVDDLMENMPALEFIERMTLETMQFETQKPEPAAQTPEQILAMFPITKRAMEPRTENPRPTQTPEEMLSVIRRIKRRG